jgi:hypothetical protein
MTFLSRMKDNKGTIRRFSDFHYRGIYGGFACHWYLPFYDDSTLVRV